MKEVIEEYGATIIVSVLGLGFVVLAAEILKYVSVNL